MENKSLPDEISSNEYRKMIENGTITNDHGRLNFSKAIDQPMPKNGKLLGQKPPKYRNKKCIYEGIKFDSELEKDYYIFLKRCGFKFEMKPKIVLQPAFVINGRKIKEIAWNPDYHISDAGVYSEIKAYSNDTFPIKLKMFLYKFKNDWNEVFVITNRNQFELSRYCIQQRINGMPDNIQEKNLLFKLNKTGKYIRKKN